MNTINDSTLFGAVIENSRSCAIRRLVRGAAQSLRLFALALVTVCSMTLAPTIGAQNASFPQATSNVNGPTAQMWRLYSPVLDSWVDVPSKDSYDFLISVGWEGKGPYYQVLTAPGSVDGIPTMPLYRLYSFDIGTHFYAMQKWAYDFLAVQGWRPEGIRAYVFPRPSASTVALERYWHPVKKRHFWTVDPADRERLPPLGYEYNGVVAYVLPPSFIATNNGRDNALPAIQLDVSTALGTEPPAQVTLIPSTTDALSNWRQVEHFVSDGFNSMKLGDTFAPPHTLSLFNVPAGIYDYKVIGTTNTGAKATSNVATVTVRLRPAAAPANILPQLSLVQPASNISVAINQPVTIQASASDTDGVVSRMEYFANSNKLGESSVAPYIYTWQPSQAGVFTISVTATDDTSAKISTGGVTVTVGTPPMTNQSPSVTILSPGNNATATVNVPVSISANASDTDGTVTKVEFFANSVKIGEDTSAPYTFTWTPTVAGAYQLTARATDNGGATGNSSAVNVTVGTTPPPNQAPTVSITAPANNISRVVNTAITITASASDSDGNVTKVEFFAGATKLGEDLTAPYSFTWTPTVLGSYALRARATDNSGATTDSTIVNVNITNTPPPNQPPTVSITAPANNAAFPTGSAVNISATAADSDGTVARVEFFVGATKIGEATAAPYNFTWTATTAGTFSITARATDNSGAATTSTAVSVIVSNAPTLTVGKTGNGGGSVTSAPAGISCGATCSATFASNSQVMLTATPDAQSTFAGWAGACSGTVNITSVTMSSSTMCTAIFSLIPVPTAGYPWPVWTSAIPAVSPSGTGRTFYVDGTNGSNTNNGTTPTTAFKTIAKALAVPLAAGDTVLIRKGLYREGIDLNAANTVSGTAAKPITFGSFGDGEVILDGSTKVTGWTLVSGTVWRAPVTFNPIGVVVNEVPLKQVTQGQGGSTAPQVGLAGVTSGSGKWHIGGGFITADMGTALGSGNPNTADIVVPSDDGAQTHVYFYKQSYIRFTGLTSRGSGSSGIWGYGNNITVESCNVKFNGKAGISFEQDGDPAFQYTDNAVITTNVFQNVLTNWPRGNNGYAESQGGWPGTVVWKGNLRPVARGNIVYMNGGEGIISYGTFAGKASGSAMFEQNVAYDNWSVNMYFDNQPNNVARNNILYNHPIDFNLATTNFLYVSSTLFPYDRLGKFGSCLMLADEQNSSDGANGFANLSGSQVYNNIIAGCRIGIRDYSEGATTIANHGLKNTLIVNNTIIMASQVFANTTTYGIYLQDNGARNTNTKIQNNIIYGYNNDSLIFSERTGAIPGTSIDYNVYFSTGMTPFASGTTVSFYNFAGWKTAMTGSDANSKFADPQLASVDGFKAPPPSPYAYQNADLATTSPARNAGTPQTFTPGVNYRLSPRSGWNAGAF
jgi:Bacterial Ig domain/Divergent InlB B-repeat domain/Repeat of unknown function (DUF5648)